MILTQEQIDKIKDIIQNYFHAFIFQNIGPEQLDEQHMRQLAEQGVQLPPDSENLFKNAFIMGKTRGNAGPEKLTNISYEEFLSQIFNRQIGTTNLDQTVVDSIKQGTAHYLHNLKDRTINTIVGTILNENREAHMQQIGEEVKTSIEQAMADSRNIQELVRELREKTGDIAYDWNRFARTEVSTAYNRGAVNAIVERNREAGIKTEDVLCYLQGPLDSATCQKCKQFYHVGGSFKIYRLSELLANGTNIGKKQAQWQPTVPPLHPHSLIDENQEIVTKKGLKKIKDVKIGDFVLTHKNRYRKVIDTLFHIPNKHNYFVKFIHKYDIFICTPEHKIFTQRGWIEAKDIRLQDKLQRITNNEIQNTEIIEIEYIRPDSIDNYKLFDITVEEDGSFVLKENIIISNCRHRLIELLPGWTLNEYGQQVYVGPGHHEFKNDLSKSLKTPTYTGYKLQKRLKFQGMDISIENKKGSKRKWKDRYGNEGETTMQNDYGYIRKTVGNDNDHVDCYIGPNIKSQKVYIVHQNDPKAGKYDEDKVMLGFDNKKQAKDAYLKHYDSSKHFGSMDEMDIDTFKDKVLGKKVDIIKSKLESLKNK